MATLEFWNMTIETEQGESATYNDAVVEIYYTESHFDDYQDIDVMLATPVLCFSAGETRPVSWGTGDYAVLTDNSIVRLRGITKVYNVYATWYRDDPVPTFHSPDNRTTYTGITRKL